ncbi:putative naphthyl-2-methyl-succinate synthase activating enzyme [uncultured Desulfobacterium sp.]|uniref:Putative naphthyl-2-methyl-succinate synthase activating enzyme n=1 Tax=uncultured Desulfobacterium sp. TaxID=201089 RepID=A0A445MYY2_9BACT|nr:putative naphthyl-2-methyl-succinate synthase activating enzyme [uncultured Desulfobacterium sp.]
MYSSSESIANENFLVTNIQRFSVNDGPGIRTTVFLKGCPLRCAWCHNPECINPFNEIYHDTQKCVRCGACAESCPEGAITPPKKVTKNGNNAVSNNSCCSVPAPQAAAVDDVTFNPPVIDRDKCTMCMKCVDACKYGAITKAAAVMTLDEVLDDVVSDEMFYKTSGGGATISGGEPLFQPNTTLALLRAFKDKGISTALDTSGYASWKIIESLLEYVDLMLFDIKTLDDEKHIKWTGVSNTLIIENAKRLAKKGKPMRLRLPIIHDVNYWDLGHPRSVVDFARQLGGSVLGIDILPYHSLSESKNERLGRQYFFKGFPNLYKEDLQDYEEIIRNGGPWEVTIGGLIGVKRATA